MKLSNHTFFLPLSNYKINVTHNDWPLMTLAERWLVLHL